MGMQGGMGMQVGMGGSGGIQWGWQGAGGVGMVASMMQDLQNTMQQHTMQQHTMQQHAMQQMQQRQMQQQQMQVRQSLEYMQRMGASTGMGAFNSALGGAAAGLPGQSPRAAMGQGTDAWNTSHAHSNSNAMSGASNARALGNEGGHTSMQTGCDAMGWSGFGPQVTILEQMQMMHQSQKQLSPSRQHTQQQVSPAREPQIAPAVGKDSPWG